MRPMPVRKDINVVSRERSPRNKQTESCCSQSALREAKEGKKDKLLQHGLVLTFAKVSRELKEGR
jgi:hypothetical protein